jgi:hypothetical protein
LEKGQLSGNPAEVTGGSMKDASDRLRQELENRQAECEGYRKSHNEASETFANRNSRLALGALISSAVGTSAIWSALNDTFPTNGGGTQVLALWGAAIAGLITTICTGVQKTSWGSADLIKAHRDSAEGYRQISGDIERGLLATRLSEEIARKLLHSVDERIHEIRTTEPTLPGKLSSELERKFEQVDRELERKFDQLNELRKLRQAGLADIREVGSSDVLQQHFREKPQLVQILETWTGHREQLQHWITEAVFGGADVQILLLDPTSDHVKFRAKSLDMAEADVQRHIEDELKELGKVLSKVSQDGGYKGKLTVRVYDATPVINMYRFDDTRLIGTYLWGEDSLLGPQLEVKTMDDSQKALLVDQFDAHFKNIWEKATKRVTTKKIKSTRKSVFVRKSEVIVDV